MTYQKVVKKFWPQSKLPDVMDTYRRLTLTVLSAYFLASALLSKIFDVGDRAFPVLTSGN